MKSNLYNVTEQLKIYLKVAKDLNSRGVWEMYKYKALGYLEACHNNYILTNKETALMHNVIIKLFDK